MPHGSKKYRDLTRALEDIQKHLLYFLPQPPISKTTYTKQELDLTRAYIVLAHAEVEAFCEELTIEKARRAAKEFQAGGTVSPVLRKLIAYYVAKDRRSWSEVLKPSADVIERACNSYYSTVHDNNGIRRQNLEKLLYPLGVHEAALDATWLAQMDSFGVNRGGWAHKSIRALNPPDPQTEVTNVAHLLQGLLKMDRVLSRKR